MAFSYDQNKSLGYLTGLTSRLFNNLLTNRFKELGIDMTAEQWGTLLVIINDGPLSQGEIAKQLYLEKSSVSRSINLLEKRGWIVRTKDTLDSRIKRVSATDKARKIAAYCSTTADAVLQDAESGINQDDMARCQAQLLDVISNLRKLTSQ